MNHSFRSRATVLGTIVCLVALQVAAQRAAKPATSLSPNIVEKFAFGKSAYIKNEHGGNAAFDVISSDLQGWGRFVLLSSPDKADLIMEVTSYEAGSTRVGRPTDYATPGNPQDASGVSKNLSGASVTLKVLEPKTHRELWTGTEKVKSAFKKKSEEDNVVAAAEKLFERFHDAVEPAP